MTFAEMQEQVWRCLEESTRHVWWTDDEVKQAIWDGEDEIADATEWLERYQMINVLEDRPYYDLRTDIRRNFLVAGPAFNVTTNRWLIPMRVRDFDAYDRRWEAHYAEPSYCTMRGIWWLGLFPRKTSAQGLIKQYYRALPIHMSEDSDEPGFHRVFHQGIVEFALSDLYAQDGEVDLALGRWNEYQRYEAGLKDYVQGRASVPMVRAAGPG